MEHPNFLLKIAGPHRNFLEGMGSMAAASPHEINPLSTENAAYSRLAPRPLEYAWIADDRRTIAQALGASRFVVGAKNSARIGGQDDTLRRLQKIVREAGVDVREGTDVKIELRCEAACDQLSVGRNSHQAIGNPLCNAAKALRSARDRDSAISTKHSNERSFLDDVIELEFGLPESSGIGIFEPFTTMKASQRGVGLSISGTIIEAQDGRIWATPNLEGGAVFNFSLPLQDAEVGA